jgi:hypothetical protein
MPILTPEQFISRYAKLTGTEIGDAVKALGADPRKMREYESIAPGITEKLNTSMPSFLQDFALGAPAEMGKAYAYLRSVNPFEDADTQKTYAGIRDIIEKEQRDTPTIGSGLFSVRSASSTVPWIAASLMGMNTAPLLSRLTAHVSVPLSMGAQAAKVGGSFWKGAKLGNSLMWALAEGKPVDLVSANALKTGLGIANWAGRVLAPGVEVGGAGLLTGHDTKDTAVNALFASGAAGLIIPTIFRNRAVTGMFEKIANKEVKNPVIQSIFSNPITRWLGTPAVSNAVQYLEKQGYKLEPDETVGMIFKKAKKAGLGASAQKWFTSSLSRDAAERANNAPDDWVMGAGAESLDRTAPSGTQGEFSFMRDVGTQRPSPFAQAYETQGEFPFMQHPNLVVEGANPGEQIPLFTKEQLGIKTGLKGSVSSSIDDLLTTNPQRPATTIFSERITEEQLPLQYRQQQPATLRGGMTFVGDPTQPSPLELHSTAKMVEEPTPAFRELVQTTPWFGGGGTTPIKFPLPKGIDLLKGTRARFEARNKINALGGPPFEPEVIKPEIVFPIEPSDINFTIPQTATLGSKNWFGVWEPEHTNALVQKTYTPILHEPDVVNSLQSHRTVLSNTISGMSQAVGRLPGNMFEEHTEWVFPPGIFTAKPEAYEKFIDTARSEPIWGTYKDHPYFKSMLQAVKWVFERFPAAQNVPTVKLISNPTLEVIGQYVRPDREININMPVFLDKLADLLMRADMSNTAARNAAIRACTAELMLHEVTHAGQRVMNEGFYNPYRRVPYFFERMPYARALTDMIDENAAQGYPIPLKYMNGLMQAATDMKYAALKKVPSMTTNFDEITGLQEEYAGIDASLIHAIILGLAKAPAKKAAAMFRAMLPFALGIGTYFHRGNNESTK